MPGKPTVPYVLLLWILLLCGTCGWVTGCSSPRPPALPSIAWSAPAPISYGTALGAAQLDARASAPGTLTYTPALGAVLPVGTQTLSVAFTPDDPAHYEPASATVTLSVTQAAPTLTWPAPSAIVYGTALSPTQLDATASIHGTFNYTPAAGTILSAGPHTLSVEFTPADPVSYASASTTVNLSVNKAVPVISWSPAGPIAVGMALGSPQLDAAAVTPGARAVLHGNFTYSPASGTVLTSSGTQTLSAQFTPDDSTDYATVNTTAALTVAPFGVAAWGDSLTYGGEGVTDQGYYPADLETAANIAVINLGIPGNSSTEIGVRQGGVTANVTVAGGVIPSSGGVTVTFEPGYAPVTDDGPVQGVTGSIAGVHGTVTYAGGICTFTPDPSGTAVSVPGQAQFVVDTPWAAYLPVFWEGRNNYNQPSQVLSDLGAQVAIVPADQTYLVMSIINANNGSEWRGGNIYNQITSLNAQLANQYGVHYLDIRHVLVEAYDPTQATDVSDYAHDEVPTSLRAVLANTTLAAPIGPADTTLQLTSSAGIGVNQVLTINEGNTAENAIVTAVSGSNVTVVRNVGGVNAAHSAGAPVIESDSVHLNGNADQIIAKAVAAFISASAHAQR